MRNCRTLGIYEKWETTIGAITESAYEVLGLEERKKRNGWFDMCCEKYVKREMKLRQTRKVYETRVRVADKLRRRQKIKYEDYLIL